MNGAELRHLFSEIPDEAEVGIVIEIAPDGPLCSIWCGEIGEDPRWRMSILGDSVKLTSSMSELLSTLPAAFWYRLGREDAETKMLLHKRISELQALFAKDGEDNALG